MIRSRLLYTLLLSAFVGTAAGAPAAVHFDIPAGDADETLRQFLASAQIEMLYLREDIRGTRTNPVTGDFSPREALERMLANTPLHAHFNDDGSFASVGKRADAK
jgi:hypothetical protein